MARDYELGIILRPDLADEDVRAIVDRVTQTVTAQGGKAVRVNAVGRRRLAYPIERHRDGLYFFFDLNLPPEAAATIERSVLLNEDILRHLLKLRDSRLVAQQRQREAEREAERLIERANEEARAAARAAAEAEAAAQAPAADVRDEQPQATTAETSAEAPASEPESAATPAEV